MLFFYSSTISSRTPCFGALLLGGLWSFGCTSCSGMGISSTYSPSAAQSANTNFIWKHYTATKKGGNPTVLRLTPLEEHSLGEKTKLVVGRYIMVAIQLHLATNSLGLCPSVLATESKCKRDLNALCQVNSDSLTKSDGNIRDKLHNKT